MKKSWRLFIACLLLVLLPLQGFAVASKLGCAMDMPVQAGSSVVSGNEHCQPAAKASGHGSDAVKAKVADHCKSSSPCCTGIALMPAPSISASVPAHDDAQVLPVLLPASVPARMLERPPKAVLV
ncbi:hypothetical protein UNDKW_3431 [Undibacterium sp. KW1]|uniref:hypothetical protein n=1 Tax=Undibacterium sp. KW1 TaxID=2058624 RepID=UPI001331E2C8|nr:hypothetical protein [Undibacterium sp. KW1]BBB61704.1 hypothetical protein UNDKW_3431 [Undibacterium sp. KW1]